jgi:hypothetical protein
VRKFVALALVQAGLLAACGGGGGGGGGGTPPPPPAIACTNANASLTQQLQNPVTLFATDNNGVIVELPTINSAGQATATGALVFGIGTQTNNGLGTAAVLTEDPATGFISATYKSTAYVDGYLDSGSNGNFFNDTFTTCPSPDQAWYCPSSTMSETATLTGQNAATATANFAVSNAQTTFNANTNFTAFADLGGPTSDAQGFDLGLPFYFGRNVFTAIENQSTPGGTGPYFAFSTPPAMTSPGPPNVESLTVDAGPAALASPAVNTPFVSVKVCVPGTSTCQTIDHIEVDTGSTGLRLMSSVLTITLPGEMDTSGHRLAECLKFADGTSWGSLAVADIQLPVSGKTASNVNVHIIGDPTYKTPPSDCSGTPENTVTAFGANGILGVGPFAQDCGSACVAAATPIPATYYSCH